MLFSLISCSKEIDNKEITKDEFISINNQNVSVIEGRLAFKDGIEFKSTINSILKNGMNIEGTNFQSRINYTEPLEKLKSGTVSEEEHIDDEDTLVFSDAFCSVLNTEHEVQVGDIVIKITPIGTILVKESNSEILNNINFNDELLKYCSKVTSAFNITSQEDLYEVTNYKGVYLFDTYHKLNQKLAEQSPKAYLLKSAPAETDFNVLSDGKTWAGNLITSIIGFSKGDWKRFSDSKYCVDVKFYSQNFGVYAEAGIKTKTQKKGWTGIWHKVECDEIVCGYDRLVLKEKWPSKLFPSIEDMMKNTTLNSANLMGKLYNYRDLGKTQQEIGNEVLATHNIFGYDIDITNKDISRALWNVLEPAWQWGNKHYGSGTNQKTAVRNVTDLSTSIFETFDRSKRSTNDDKLTYIFGSDFGFLITVTNSGNYFKSLEGLAAKFSYEKGTVLYGCARRGSEWKGIKLVFD
jgi:hypothetical protein